VALVATAMSFAIRGDIMGDFERVFALSKTEVGWIAGAAFWGFGLSILIGGPLCDVLGMRALSRLAVAGHVLGTLLTIAAPNFAVLFTATLLIGIANGLVEAFANPLVATLFPRDKTTRLVAFHAWFPGGIVIGGLLSYLFSQLGLGWQPKMLLLLVPTAVYAAMFGGQAFPPTEGRAAGVTLGRAFKEIGRPLFLVVWLCMWLTAATELGPGRHAAGHHRRVRLDCHGDCGAGDGVDQRQIRRFRSATDLGSAPGRAHDCLRRPLCSRPRAWGVSDRALVGLQPVAWGLKPFVQRRSRHTPDC
jgi:MFS family permease